MYNNLVQVVVLGYNNKNKLVECLLSLEKTDYPNVKIILADNNSVDGSVEFVQEHFPKVEIIRFKQNYGFIAYNYVIDEMQGEYIALINNDIVVNSDWLKNLMPHILRNDVAAVVPKLLLYSDKRRINAVGGMMDIFGVAWNKGNGELDNGQYDEVKEVFYGVGAVLLLKKSVWQVIGGFDERYFMAAEDVDWSWRARIAGYKIICEPKSIAYHHWLNSVGLSDRLIYISESHQIANFIKNYDVSTKVRLAPILVIIKLSKIVYLFIRRKPRLALATLRAIWWNLLNFKGSIEQRKKIKIFRKIQDKEVQETMIHGSLEVDLGLRRTRQPAIDSLLKRDSMPGHP